MDSAVSASAPAASVGARLAADRQAPFLAQGRATVRKLSGLRPMLASPGYLPPEGSGFAYEFKWDGMRVLVRVEGDKVEAESRNGNDAAARFPELKGLPKALGKAAKAGIQRIDLRGSRDRPNRIR